MERHACVVLSYLNLIDLIQLAYISSLLFIIMDLWDNCEFNQ